MLAQLATCSKHERQFIPTNRNIRHHLTVVCSEGLAFWSSSNKLKLSICIREMLGLNLGQDYLEVFHGIHQFLQANSGTARFGHDHFLPNPFQYITKQSISYQP
jgi:hypothetical protein